MPSSPPIAVLGPQRHIRTVARVLETLGRTGGERIATVTAGWEDREGEDRELHEHLWGKSFNLRLYERSDACLREDKTRSKNYNLNCNLSALRVCLVALKADLHPEASWPELQERCQHNPNIPFHALVNHRLK